MSLLSNSGRLAVQSSISLQSISTWMPQNRSGYTLPFEEVVPGDDSFGHAAVIPWDSDIFGFPVAQYRIGSDRIEEYRTDALNESLLSWLHRNDVALCSCAVAAS